MEVIKELIKADFARVSVDKVMDYTFESLCKNQTWSLTVQLTKLVGIGTERTLSTVIMSYNASAKVVTEWSWHFQDKFKFNFLLYLHFPRHLK